MLHFMLINMLHHLQLLQSTCVCVCVYPNKIKKPVPSCVSRIARQNFLQQGNDGKQLKYFQQTTTTLKA